MKRRTLDISMSVGGTLLAGLAVVLGLVFQANADFATTYVRDQLSEQQISFPPLEGLSEEESGVACLAEYAGATLDDGKKSECYANEYIGSHLKNIGGGETYATLGTPQRELQAKVADAKKASDPNLATLEADLAKVTGQRETMFKGETCSPPNVIGPPHPTPHASRRTGDSSICASISFLSAPQTDVAGVWVCIRDNSSPVVDTTPTASFVPPISMARKPEDLDVFAKFDSARSSIRARLAQGRSNIFEAYLAHRTQLLFNNQHTAKHRQKTSEGQEEMHLQCSDGEYQRGDCAKTSPPRFTCRVRIDARRLHRIRKALVSLERLLDLLQDPLFFC